MPLNTTEFPRVAVYLVGATPSAGPFNIPFPFYDADSVQVFVNDVEVLDFTISKPSQLSIEGNTITLDVPVANARVVVLSNTGNARITGDTVSQDGLSKEIDRIFAIFQEMQEVENRTLRLSPGATIETIEFGDQKTLYYDLATNRIKAGATLAEIESAAASADSAVAAAAAAEASAAEAALFDPTGFAPLSHDHAISDVTGLQGALDGKASLAGAETLTNKSFGDGTKASGGTASWTGTASLDPANGLVQEITLTGNVTLTDNLADGESLVLHIDDGADRVITWPTITWVSNNGTQPDLQTTADTIISIWKVGATLYGFAANGA